MHLTIDEFALEPKLSTSWLPTEVKLSGELSCVEWLNFADTTPHEPHFYQTVSRLRSEQRPIITDLMALACLKSSDRRPAGFIFHIGRCGSTLLSNCLMLADSTVVIAEPSPVSALLTPLSHAGWPIEGQDWSQLRRALLCGAINRYLGFKPKSNVVIKFTSWNLVYAEIMKSLWPRTPYIIVVRDPCEVVVSLLKDPTNWIRERDTPGVPRPAICSSDPEYCAYILARYFRIALDCSASDPFCRIVDYDLITPALVNRMGIFFGLHFQEESCGELLGRFRVYSKDARRQTRFAPDKAAKQLLANGPVRMATRSLTSMYAALRRRSELSWNGV